MKKGVWRTFDFGPQVKPVSPTVTKTDNEKDHNQFLHKIHEKLPTKRRNFNFHAKSVPQTINDLAIHPKKIEEVLEWMKLNIHSCPEKTHPSFLLVSGPTGSGKTTTINVICRELGIAVSEWINPMDYDYESFRGIGQVNKFSEFLNESRWNSLFDVENDKKITLVKDFPNAVIRQPYEFFIILEDCYNKINHPVVFICTETSKNGINLLKSLFPDEIMSKYNIAHISFNPCAPMLLKTVVKRVQKMIQENTDLYKQPSSESIDAILATAMGDIRSVMNQLYFASLLVMVTMLTE